MSKQIQLVLDHGTIYYPNTIRDEFQAVLDKTPADLTQDHGPVVIRNGGGDDIETFGRKYNFDRLRSAVLDDCECMTDLDGVTSILTPDGKELLT